MADTTASLNAKRSQLPGFQTKKQFMSLLSCPICLGHSCLAKITLQLLTPCLTTEKKLWHSFTLLWILLFHVIKHPVKGFPCCSYLCSYWKTKWPRCTYQDPRLPRSKPTNSLSHLKCGVQRVAWKRLMANWSWDRTGCKSPRWHLQCIRNTNYHGLSF